MEVYKTKTKKIPGSDYHEVNQRAYLLYNQIRRRTKRRPYVRSVYFNKSKIFLELFWQHLWKKENFRDKVRRLKYFPCAIELIERTICKPTTKNNPNNSSEMLHRFAGSTPENDLFFVQVKENKKTKEIWLMSIFPEKNKKTFR